VFNMFEEIFAPGRKHTSEERKRLELSRVDAEDGAPGRGPIDLASGKVVIRLSHEASDDNAAQDDSAIAAGLPADNAGEGADGASPDITPGDVVTGATAPATRGTEDQWSGDALSPAPDADVPTGDRP